MTDSGSSSPGLHLLDDSEDFRAHALEMANRARRSIDILSTDLDFPIYHQPPFLQSLSELARRSRSSRVRVLVKSTAAMVERGHGVAQLAQRLPSRLAIRKLSLAPQDKTMAYMIVDRELLLFKNDDAEYRGFANYSAQPEARRLLEEFTYLWEHHSDEDPQLRLLTL